MAGMLTVGQAARRAQLTPRAVRLYEAHGLLPAAPRSDAGYRFYTEEDLRLLRFIGQARTLGLGLKDIQALIDLRQARSHTCFEQAKASVHRSGQAGLCRILEHTADPPAAHRRRS